MDKTVCLTCGTLEAEIRRLVDRGVFDFEVFPVEELFLHDPFDAKRCIQGVFKTFRANRYRPIVICTDEYVNLSRICKEFDIPRLGGKTASSIILGETVAQELHQAGSLTLLPAVFQGDLYRLMDEINEMKTVYGADNLIYLDTGIAKVPFSYLYELSFSIKMPFEVRHTSLDNLFLQIDKLISPSAVTAA